MIDAIKYIRDNLYETIAKVDALMGRFDDLENENKQLRLEVEALKSSNDEILKRLDALEKNNQ